MPKGEERALATGAAFEELRRVALALAGPEGLERVHESLSAEASAALTATPPEGTEDPLFAEVLLRCDEALSAGTGAFARAVGKARGDAVLATDRAEFDGDPLRFLKVNCGSLYRDRCNYGGGSLELVPHKAIVRLIFPEYMTLRQGEALNRGTELALGFLQHVVFELSGTAYEARYSGFALRAEPRFGHVMYNQHFEFDLE